MKKQSASKKNQKDRKDQDQSLWNPIKDEEQELYQGGWPFFPPPPTYP